MKRLKIFTWHIHGAYLSYLSQIPHDIYIPIKPLSVSDNAVGYIGKVGAISAKENIHEIPIEHIRETQFDCILFQSKSAYLNDQYDSAIFADEQLKLPKIYLEHDPPREHPTDTQHFVDGRDTFLVHVTHYNSLMWDSGTTKKRVIEHGVSIKDKSPVIEPLKKGITVINNLKSRDRRLGCDIFLKARNQIPLDLVGMDAESLGGLGEVPLHELPSLLVKYRFLFHPVRYTSLALAVCEAMAVGLPIIGLATTELPTVIQNEISGYLSNNLNDLIPVMEELNMDWKLAYQWGQAAKEVAQERFGIERFVREWNDVLNLVVGQEHGQQSSNYQ
jgi:glycosyltransferase involved in cell wall biosynthesis